MAHTLNESLVPAIALFLREVYCRLDSAKMTCHNYRVHQFTCPQLDVPKKIFGQ